MLKRKKPRQNSASTSPSSSPPNQGLTGILPSDLSQKILQHQQSMASEKDNNNSSGSSGSSSSKNRENKERDHNNKKKKNKSKRSPSSEPPKSVSESQTASISINQPTTNIIPNNNNHNNHNHHSSSPKSNPKKHQKSTTENTSNNKEKQQQEESSEKSNKSFISSKTTSGPDTIMINEQKNNNKSTTTQPSPIISSTQPILNLSSQPEFVPLFIDEKKQKQQTELTEKHNQPTTHNNNTLHSPQQNINNNFQYNNSSFSYSKNKSSSSSGSLKKPTHIPLWLEGHGYTTKDVSTIQLNKEIELFTQWLEPSELETRIRQKIIRDVHSIVKENWSKATVVIFGSFSSNLFVPTSDIDIQISDINEDGGAGVNNSSSKYNNYTNPIRDFFNILIRNHQGSFSNVRLISGAKIPIIKMTSANSHYNVDVCFDTPNGIENTKVVRELLGKYKSMRTLLLVLKFFLHQNNLNETYTGGIGSYALALMVVSFIQLRFVPHHLRSTPSSHKSRKEYKHAGDSTDYGAMLIEFLELYGRSFNYSLYGISLEHGGYYYKKGDDSWGSNLTLIDPHDRDNDVGKSSFNIPFIRGVFSNSFLKLVSPEMLKDQYSRFSFPTGLSKFIEERLVEQIARERKNVVKYAQQLEESDMLPPLITTDELISMMRSGNNNIKTSSNSIEVPTTINNQEHVIDLIDESSCSNNNSDDEDEKLSSRSEVLNNNNNNSNKNNGSNSSSSSSGEEFSEESQNSDIHSSEEDEFSDSGSNSSRSSNGSNSSESEDDEYISSKKKINNNNNNISNGKDIPQKLNESIGFSW